MSAINYDLNKIKAPAFDVDRVLSANVIPMSTDNKPLHTVNIKGGYALHLTTKHEIPLAIITDGRTEAMCGCFLALGIPAENIYMGSSVRIHDYRDFRDRYSLQDEGILYVGDDVPDIEVMSTCDLPCCPDDAAPKVKSVARYVPYKAGGYGYRRDVIEQFLKVKGLWMVDERAFGW